MYIAHTSCIFTKFGQTHSRTVHQTRRVRCENRRERNEWYIYINRCLWHSKDIEHGNTGHRLGNKNMLLLILMEMVVCFHFKYIRMQWFIYRHHHVLDHLRETNASYVLNSRIHFIFRGINLPVHSYLWTFIGWYRQMKSQGWWSMSRWGFRRTMTSDMIII